MYVKQIFRWIWPTSVGISSLLLHVPPFIPPSSCSCVTLLSRISYRFSLGSLELLTRAISSLHQEYFQRNADNSTFSPTILWIKERKDQNEYHGKGFYANQANIGSKPLCPRKCNSSSLKRNSTIWKAGHKTRNPSSGFLLKSWIKSI